MNEMSALLFERSEHDRVVAGVCGGLAARLGVDATLVRLVFALLALAGGAGILLYFALWAYGEGWRTWAAAALIAAAGAMLLLALGLSTTAVVGATLLVAGFATVVIRGGSLRPGGSLPILGVTLLLAGAVIFLGTERQVRSVHRARRRRGCTRACRWALDLAVDERTHRADPYPRACRGCGAYSRLRPADTGARASVMRVTLNESLRLHVARSASYAAGSTEAASQRLHCWWTP